MSHPVSPSSYPSSSLTATAQTCSLPTTLPIIMPVNHWLVQATILLGIVRYGMDREKVRNPQKNI